MNTKDLIKYKQIGVFDNKPLIYIGMILKNKKLRKNNLYLFNCVEYKSINTLKDYLDNYNNINQNHNPTFIQHQIQEKDIICNFGNIYSFDKLVETYPEYIL